MGDEFKEIVMSHIKKDIMLNSLNKGERFDGRKFDEYRPIEVHKNVIKTAEGSALVRIGESQVLAGVKFDAVTPFSDRPTQGTFVVSAELLPLASPSFEGGPPDENAIELARVVDRGIRSSEAVDLNSLFITEGKVLGIYIDLYVLDHSGNLIDTAALAAMAALTATKFPKVENAKIVRGEYTGPLTLNSACVATTFGKIGNHWIVDANRDEEMAFDTRISIATTKTHVCAMQKAKGSLTKTELLDLVDKAFKKGDELRSIIGY